MNKILFTVAYLVCFASASAQRKNANERNLISLTGCINTLGSSANSFTSFGAPLTNLWADPVLNTIIFIHRSNSIWGIGSTTGELYFDISKDGGNTWANNVGPIYTNPTNDFRARYPQAIIYNPPGNTNPDSSFISSFNATTDGADWLGNTYASASLSSVLNANQFVDTFNIPTFKGSVTHSFFVDKNGITYNADAHSDILSISGSVYDSAFYFYKGTWNTSSNTYNYVRTKVYMNLDTTNTGWPLFSKIATCFNDTGNFGYISILGSPADMTQQSYSPCIIKSANGGSTWDSLGVFVNLSNLDSIYGAPLPSGFVWSFNESKDVLVDFQSNLHIVGAVYPFDTVNGNIMIASGQFMIVDVYTIDQGNNWRARLLSKPMTCYGEWDDNAGATAGDRNRASISRTWSGDKIFYTYFDTDTNQFPGVGNIHPDAYCMGYDVNTGLTTPVVNISLGSPAQSACIFGNTSYYVFGNTGSYSVPITYQELTGLPLSVGVPCYHHYFCGNITDAMFTLPDNSIALDTSMFKLVNITSNDEYSNVLNLFQPYPNPTNNVLNIPVYSPSLTNAQIEITNLLGQKIKSVSLNILQGQQSVKISLSDFTKGIYFVLLTADKKTATAKFVIE